MRFPDRRSAGLRLAAEVLRHPVPDAVVLALPRGGVPVGYEVARALGVPLGLAHAVRVSAPGAPAVGIGAVAPGVTVLDEPAIERMGVTPRYLELALEEAREDLERRMRRYGDGGGLPVGGRTVVVVDDGLAFGVTAAAALRSLRRAGPGRLLLAVPVASREGLALVRGEADAVVAVLVPEPFGVVGRWYEDFAPPEDEEVRRLLAP